MTKKVYSLILQDGKNNIKLICTQDKPKTRIYESYRHFYLKGGGFILLMPIP